MNLNLDRILEATRRGQWSVDDFDWSRPLEGTEHLTKREKRDAGMALVFVAGLERQAARVFALCAEYTDDPRAREIYRLFEVDEQRHAAVELRMAARLGVHWRDQSLPVRWMFKTLAKNFDPPSRAVHEVSAATILLFELALDSILIPALKELIDDSLQAEVFRRIDLDESRHLAMDYWLLDEKGAYFQGRELREVLEEELGRSSLRQRVQGRLALWKTMVAFIVGFGANSLAMRSLSKNLNDPKKFEKYLSRVNAVPKKAPRALDVPGYRMGLKGQSILLKAGAMLINTPAGSANAAP